MHSKMNTTPPTHPTDWIWIAFFVLEFYNEKRFFVDTIYSKKIPTVSITRNRMKSINCYSCVFNTSHTVLGDMPNFYENPVCITRHAIPFYERPGCNTEHTNSLLMWQWHHYCFEVTREGLRPGCNSRHGTLFTQRPGWNKRIWGKIQWVLNRSPVTCIQD